jgi:hypothetical protein
MYLNFFVLHMHVQRLYLELTLRRYAWAVQGPRQELFVWCHIEYLADQSLGQSDAAAAVVVAAAAGI